ncbi:hypothetical protein LCGC14_2503850 [marine sediment metagenome]|uniref:Uncharacterized protein n=1 Tax=marine sediment metagenome TaxID=412755 RepID=A0A0F9BP22_9ZZZZ
MNDKAEVVKLEPTYSQRFTNVVVKEFGGTVGKLSLTPLQERLAQHLFVAIDTQLKSLEVKRALDKSKKDNAPIAWENINMNKLAIDSVHRIELGLDALIPNHIHPIPYWNKRLEKYDLSLDVGYVGKDYYKRKMALEPPLDIRYELVYSNDEFMPIKKSALSEVESYEFKIKNAFDRGEVVGGFGYISYTDPKKNTLVLVTKDDMEKSRKAAKSDAFWKPHPTQMQFVVLVRRTTAKINVDPEKVNASLMAVEMDETVQAADRDIEENANKEALDIDSEKEQIIEIDKNGEVQTVEERKAAGEMTSIEPEDDEHQVQAPRQKFQDDIRSAANILGVKRYAAILQECGHEIISKVPEKEFDKYRRVSSRP